MVLKLCVAKHFDKLMTCHLCVTWNAREFRNTFDVQCNCFDWMTWAAEASTTTYDFHHVCCRARQTFLNTHDLALMQCREQPTISKKRMLLQLFVTVHDQKLCKSTDVAFTCCRDWKMFWTSNDFAMIGCRKRPNSIEKRMILSSVVAWSGRQILQMIDVAFTCCRKRSSN